MVDREKVIKGLEACSLAGTKDDCIGYGCPYLIYNDEVSDDCQDQMFDDAIALLKAQEPRVMTLEDLQRVQENEAPVWLESRGTWHGRKGFWIFVYEITPEKKVMRYNAAHMCECGWLGLGAYNKIWRCWTSRPTDAQREATPWN